MDVREKLVELIHNADNDKNLGWYDLYDLCREKGCAEYFADYLIAHGVTVQESDGCDFCKKFDFAGARAEADKYGAHISLAICNTKFPDEEQFKFCPTCGRKLPQPPKGE